jgi:glutamate/tyrosine decarboxylase-like PLP-dependent enzyme
VNAREAATRSSGPRFFHFVMGGGTPAALGADWLTSAYDQIAFAWASSPFAARLEQVAVDWLRQLFELPSDFGGVITTGATMANFVALAAARNWWGELQGVDVEQEGVGKLAPAVILSSGYIHPSAIQAVGMLGIGRENISQLARDDVGRLDLVALERELEQAAAPVIVIANAGEVNAGDFDPIADVADLCERHTAWLHVDGAFGLFARLTPSTRALTEGVERADSVIADGHKWLNVPYDCGFAFVREMERLPRALNVGAPYLPSPDDPHPNFAFVAPENSRRARALAVWATLRAYGRAGYREMVERHVRLARHLADRVDASPELERLADVPLNIVCFRSERTRQAWTRNDSTSSTPASLMRCAPTAACSSARPPTQARPHCDQRSSTGGPTFPTSTSWSTSRASSPRQNSPSFAEPPLAIHHRYGSGARSPPRRRLLSSSEAMEACFRFGDNPAFRSLPSLSERASYRRVEGR